MGAVRNSQTSHRAAGTRPGARLAEAQQVGHLNDLVFTAVAVEWLGKQMQACPRRPEFILETRNS